VIDQSLEPKEEAFLAEQDHYVNKWIAILNYNSEDQVIVGSGGSIQEARRDAASKGFVDVTFFKVPSPNQLFVPSTGGCET